MSIEDAALLTRAIEPTGLLMDALWCFSVFVCCNSVPGERADITIPHTVIPRHACWGAVRGASDDVAYARLAAQRRPCEAWGHTRWRATSHHGAWRLDPM